MSTSDPWYFACDCGAKFFNDQQSSDCPRCGEHIRSPERIKPPWRKRLHTVKEAAELLSVSPAWLYEKVNRGEIEHHKLGGTAIRFSDEDLEGILQESKRTKLERGEPVTRKAQAPRPNLRHIQL